MCEALTPSSLATSLNTGIGGSLLRSVLGLEAFGLVRTGGMGTRCGPAACAKRKRGTSRKRATTTCAGALKRVEFMRQGQRGFADSLRFSFHLRRPHNHGLVVLKRASTEILRASQRFLGEFGLAELPVRQRQLIMDIAVMIQRSGPLELWNGIGKLPQAHVRGAQQAAGFGQIRLQAQSAL